MDNLMCLSQNHILGINSAHIRENKGKVLFARLVQLPSSPPTANSSIPYSCKRNKFSIQFRARNEIELKFHLFCSAMRLLGELCSVSVSILSISPCMSIWATVSRTDSRASLCNYFRAASRSSHEARSACPHWFLCSTQLRVRSYIPSALNCSWFSSHSLTRFTAGPTLILFFCSPAMKTVPWMISFQSDGVEIRSANLHLLKVCSPDHSYGPYHVESIHRLGRSWGMKSLLQ